MIGRNSRRSAIAALLLALFCAGCAGHYNLTLTNGHVISTRGKPRYDAAAGVYRYKNLNGQPATVPAFRVKEIAPSSGWTSSEPAVMPPPPRGK